MQKLNLKKSFKKSKDAAMGSCALNKTLCGYNAIAVILDLISIAVFVILGIIFHGSEFSLYHILSVSFPFVLSYAASYAYVAAWRNPLNFGCGIKLWFATALFGCVIRWATHDAIGIGFIILAFIFLALFFLGWRKLITYFVPNSKNTAL